jgi:hypothetical protein
MNSLQQGEIPHWTPHIYAGMPFMADLQTGVFYPPHWALFLLQGFFLPGGVIFIWFILGHVLLFGYGIYKLCLAFSLNRAASVYAATAMMFCGFISMHVHHPNALYVLAWFPWSFLYLKKCFETNRLKYLGFASLLFGISILGGYSQYTAFCSLILLFYTLYFSWSNRGKGFKVATTICSSFGLFLFLSLGLALVQLLPTAELYSESVRTTMSWAKSVDGSLSVNNLITLLAPKFFGQVNGMNGTTYWHNRAIYLFWETAIFIGILPLILISIRLLYRERGKSFFFFLTVGVFGLIMAMGKHLPLYSLFFQLPGFSKFRIPGRFSFIFAFGFIMASAISLNNLQRQKITKSGYPKKGLVFGIIISITMVISLALATILIEIPTGRKPETFYSVLLALMTILMAWILVIWLLRSRSKAIPTLAIILFVFFELFLFAHGFAPGPLTGRQVYPPRGMLLKLKAQNQSSPFRLYYRNIPLKGQENRRVLYHNLGSVYKIDTINGYNQLQLSRFFHFMNKIEFEKAMQLLNTKYLITVTGPKIEKSPALKNCSRFNLRSSVIQVKSGQEAIDQINDRNSGCPGQTQFLAVCQRGLVSGLESPVEWERCPGFTHQLSV